MRLRRASESDLWQLFLALHRTSQAQPKQVRRGRRPHAIDATQYNMSSLNNKLSSFISTRDRRREGSRGGAPRGPKRDPAGVREHPGGGPDARARSAPAAEGCCSIGRSRDGGQTAVQVFLFAGKAHVVCLGSLDDREIVDLKIEKNAYSDSHLRNPV